MMIKYKKVFFIIIFFLLLNGISLTSVYAAEEHFTGEVKLTEEEMEELLDDIPEIVDVKLNKKALENIKKSPNYLSPSMLSEIEVVEMGDEIITDQDIGIVAVQSASEEVVTMQEITEEELPSFVDVSQNDTFPPIGNQEESSSCGAWSLGYYQLTNNIANLRGFNVKENINCRISPKWLFNLGRRGGKTYDKGTNMFELSDILLNYGAAYWSDCEWDVKESNMESYMSWNPGSKIWESALYNKIDSMACVKVVEADGKTLDLLKLKALLNNGYVVSFSTDYNYWTISTTGVVKTKMTETGVKYAVTEYEYICTSVNNIDAYLEDEEQIGPGTHAMTIVGYDDKIPVDVDGDNVIDTFGALKIANSWGDDYEEHNAGYIWLAYDALRKQSVVTRMNTPIRQNAIWLDQVYYLQARASYTPLLLAEITVKTNSRSQLKVEMGISRGGESEADLTNVVSGDEENKLVFNYKEYEENENYNFVGGTENKEGTFVFDLTPIIEKYWNKNVHNVEKFASNQFFVKLSDKTADAYTNTLSKVTLIDRVNNVTQTKKLDLTANGNTVTTSFSYTIVPKLVEKDHIFTVSFNYPIQQSTINLSNFKVCNKHNKEVEISLSNNKYERDEVKIYSPKNGYLHGNYYTLFCKNVETDGGNRLNKEATYEFYVVKEDDK